MVFTSFLITFRESLEAALVVSIVAAYLRKVGQIQLWRYLWAGTGLAIGTSIALGWAVQIVYGGLTGASAQLFEGVASLTATGVLSYVVFWMAGNARKIKEKIERKIEVAITRGQMFSIAAIAFVAVVREGIETVLFLTALFFLDPSGTTIGMMVGITLVGIVSVLLLRGTYNVDVRRFFRYSSVLLIIFAAGLAGYGVHELIEAAESYGLELGVLAQQVYNINPASSANLLHENGAVGSILKSLVGYDGNPEWLRVLVYAGYWLTIGTYVFKTYAPESGHFPVKPLSRLPHRTVNWLY